MRREEKGEEEKGEREREGKGEEGERGYARKTQVLYRALPIGNLKIGRSYFLQNNQFFL